eukprot:3956645-Prymnesium_polylepis.1
MAEARARGVMERGAGASMAPARTATEVARGAEEVRAPVEATKAAESAAALVAVEGGAGETKVMAAVAAVAG